MASIDDLCATLEKELGKNAERQSVTRFINTGYPPLNKTISGHFDGGLPFGRIIEMYSLPSHGKTALATQWMAQAQKMGGIAIFIDWERSFDVELAKGFGLNDQRPYWLYAQPDTWEKGNIFVAKACKLIRDSKAIPDDAPILCVFDSVASAVPQSMTDKEIDEYTMNDTTALARVASTTLKSMAQHAANYDATFLYLNQVRTKPGVVYGDSTTCPGGVAMEFYATVRMHLSRKKLTDNTKQFIGQSINIKCTKSKLTRPFQECALDMVYDDLGVAHFDAVGSTLNYLIDEKIVKTAGPRVVWADGKNYWRKDLLEKINSEGGLEILMPMLPH